MGKWTLQYHDEVLRDKIKSLVTGAVKRAKLEKGEPSITYEAFVEELDEGDSFTASLIDVLVKVRTCTEMAERRMRPNPIDRRLISERTAKTLRMQAAPLHVYRGRQNSLRDRTASRRSLTVPHYVSMVDDMPPSEEEDEYGTVLGSGSAIHEGFRVNSDLYDAYLPTPSFDFTGSFSRANESNALPSTSFDAANVARDSFAVTSPRSASPPALPSPTFITRSGWTANPPSSGSGPGSNLTRQNSIRRLARSRTVDFNDFTHRRRSSIRQNTTQDQEHAVADGPSDPVWRFNMYDHVIRPEEPSTSSTGTATARRFFPLTSRSQALRRLVGDHPYTSVFPWSPADTAEPSPPGSTAAEEPAASSGGPTSSQLWYSLTDINEDERQAAAPRLRREGVRHQESLLSRYASPASEEQPSQSAGPLEGSDRAAQPGNEAQTETLRAAAVSAEEVATQFPTPRSPSPAATVIADLDDQHVFRPGQH
ncbi:hypothetical protein A0H81_09631 [Grifola frondosa]|uniref:Uncharacterized protein n=1 Tax=Grifola frondosa TaxID=5627 RepID=A0A1C7M037_GRIFR|nr:hypothetical protein A0H81_09631 [Grifola frondosa]